MSVSTSESDPRSKQGYLFPVSVGLFGLAVVYARFLLTNSQQGYGFQWPLPFEDAAMLFRYAENLAAGFGIVWNQGESPGSSDGATDLGFVLLLAPLIRLGISPSTAGLLVNALGLFAIGYWLGRTNRDKWLLPAPIPFLLTAMLAISVWSPMAGGFSSAAFGAILLGTFFCAQRAMARPAPTGLIMPQYVLVGVLAGLSGWWRPEGFLLAPFVVLLSLLTPSNAGRLTRPRELLSVLLSTVAAFSLLLLGWVLFRLTYFGYLTPTAGTNKLESLYWALVNSASTLETVGTYYVTALLPILTAALLIAIVTARSTSVLAPLAGVALAAVLWTPFDLTFNWWGRIWWPLIPTLVAWIVTFLAQQVSAARLNSTKNLSGLRGVILTGVGLAIIIAFPTPSTGEWPPQYERLPFHTLMYETLRPLDTTSLRVATTEAGLVPLALDEGSALDTWVHNTRAIAEGGVDALPAELNRFGPNVIVVHGPTPTEFLGGKTCTQFDPDWTTQARTLYDYAADANFSLVRVDKTGPCDAWSIFVAPEAPSDVVAALDEAPNWADRIY